MKTKRRDDALVKLTYRSASRIAPTVGANPPRTSHDAGAVETVSDPEGPYLGSAETAMTPNSEPLAQHEEDDCKISATLIAALSDCHRLGPTQLLAPVWKERVESFVPPYRLFLEMCSGGEPAIDLVLADPYFKSERIRAPSRSKVALIAINIFVKPAAEYRSLCSDYAYVLEHARDQGIDPMDLPAWLRSTTLSNCKSAVRRSRRLLKVIEAVADPAAGADPSQLIDDVSSAFGVKVSGRHVAVCLSLPFGDREQLPQLLRRLADEIEHATWGDGDEINGQLP
ncbi:hypothetical protein NKJ71_09525 [Mesorhizobium sp. M0050]|uniref:hypothetical protein n=1 Tax=Mesorhizobium sp. M0050 TaxID=2956861 RepID=UPI00333743E9